MTSRHHSRISGATRVLLDALFIRCMAGHANLDGWHVRQ